MNMAWALPRDAVDPGHRIAQRRPHFHRRGAALHFLGSRRPFRTLSVVEIAVWDALSSPCAEEGLDAFALDALADAGVVDIFPPPRPGRRRVLVIEPHSDDAALSIGGLMWMRREEEACHVVTLASRSNYTSAFVSGRGETNRDRVTALRSAEGETWARHLGGRHEVLGLPEATMRYHDADWDAAFLAAHRISVAASNNARADDAVLETWTARLTAFLDEGPGWDEIRIPLGAGTHSDHDLARNACLRALAEGAGRGARLAFYLDVPYGADFPDHRDALLAGLAARGAALDPRPIDVTEAWADKQRLLGVFGSQFKPGAIAAGQDLASAWQAAPGQRLEHLWEIRRLPEPRDLHELSWPWLEARGLEGAMAALVARARAAGRLRVVLLDAAGGWPARLADLRRAVGDVAVEVVASDAARPEVARAPGAGVTVTPLAPGQAARATALLRAGMGRTPVLIVAGTGAPKVRRAAALLPWAPVTVVRTLSAASMALQSSARSRFSRAGRA